MKNSTVSLVLFVAFIIVGGLFIKSENRCVELNIGILKRDRIILCAALKYDSLNSKIENHLSKTCPYRDSLIHKQSKKSGG